MNKQPPLLSSTRWGARTKRIVVLICLFILAGALILLRNLLPLLIVALLLSYLLYPITNFIEARVLRRVLPFRARSLAVMLTFVVMLALFGLVMWLVAPVIINQVVQLGENVPAFFQSLEADVENWLSRPLAFNSVPILIDGEPVIPLERFQEITGQEDITDMLQTDNLDAFALFGAFVGSLGDLTGPAFEVLGGFLNVIINIAFLLVMMFYFMRDGEVFAGHIISATPESYRGDVRRLLFELGRVWNAYLRGQIIISASVGVAVYIAATILGLPNAPVLGLISASLEFIPNIGPALALIPAVTIALFSESSTFPFLEGVPLAILVVVIWVTIQNVETFYLVPRVMGSSLDLHPLVVIIAIIAGASIAGALGVILAAPMTATLRLLAQYIYGKLFDIDPFPASTAPRRAAQAVRPPGWSLVMRRFDALRSTPSTVSHD